MTAFGPVAVLLQLAANDCIAGRVRSFDLDLRKYGIGHIPVIAVHGRWREVNVWFKVHC